MINDWGYDIETYPNVFTIAFEHAGSGIKVAYEISTFRNDSKELLAFLKYLRSVNARMVGFNNLGFDYPVVHMFMKMGRCDAPTLYAKAMSIIQSQGNDESDKWAHQVNPGDRFIEQIDLFKIHHFDNKARSTSLKVLEFNMLSDTIEDLPFEVGTNLTQDQLPILKQYNAHDVSQTIKFYHESKDMLHFREQLTAKYDRDFMNHNDTRIGKDYFIMELEKAGVTCYEYGTKGRTPRQTKREMINLKDAILPWINFESPEFNRILNWMKSQSITETKGIFKDLNATVNGFNFVFGLGGIHGSVENEVIVSTDDEVIIDLDVKSYYPNLGISNNFYPAHLSSTFCTIYETLYNQRSSFGKKTAENAMLKLALNGVYGDSNNPFSVFYDPLFTMSITLNGQLLICLLAEWLMKIEGMKLIQCNTDGLTIKVNKSKIREVENVRSDWEKLTKLQLEEMFYSKMYIRDVNNYLAQYDNGTVKRKGCYEYELDWHQNASALVVPKVAEKVLIEGAPIRETILNWGNKYDFMLRTKVPRSSQLTLEVNGECHQIQNVTRYYISKEGGYLFKRMPPLKGKTEWRKIGVESGWVVKTCNNINEFDRSLINYEYYTEEVEKICLILQ